jgi:hypothetical protein
VTVDLPPETYLTLRREASLSDTDPGTVAADALSSYFDS